MSTTYPDKQIIVATLDKRLETSCLPLRARNDYFYGTLYDVRGLLFQNGQRLGERIHYQQNP